MVEGGKKQAEQLTPPDPRLCLYEPHPLPVHIPKTPLSHIQINFCNNISATQMPRGRYVPTHLLSDSSSTLDTAAKSRSLRNAGVYSVYYGTIPPFRPESLSKWMAKVRLS